MNFYFGILVVSRFLFFIFYLFVFHHFIIFMKIILTFLVLCFSSLFFFKFNKVSLSFQRIFRLNFAFSKDNDVHFNYLVVWEGHCQNS